jgi:hypothetical protein
MRNAMSGIRLSGAPAAPSSLMRAPAVCAS